MDRERFTRATYPGIMGTSSMMLLREMAETNREQALQALTAALVRPEALELADALEAPAAEARAAAEPYETAIVAAQKALDKEEASITRRLAAFFEAKLAGKTAAGAPEPERTSPRIQELKLALSAAERDAMPFVQRANYHAEQIRGLRAAPKPDPAVMAILAAAITEQEGSAS